MPNTGTTLIWINLLSSHIKQLLMALCIEQYDELSIPKLLTKQPSKNSNIGLPKSKHLHSATTQNPQRIATIQLIPSTSDDPNSPPLKSP